MSYVPDDFVERSEKCTRGEIRTFMAICHRADKDGVCWPSLRQLAEDLETDRGNVFRYRAGLVQKGLISFDPATHIIKVLFGFPRPGSGVVKSTTPPVVKPTTKDAVKSTTGNGSDVVKSTTGRCQIDNSSVVNPTAECCQIDNVHIRTEPVHEPVHLNQPIEPVQSFSEQLQTPISTNEILPISSAELFGENLTIPRQTNPRQSRAAQADEVYEYWKVAMKHPGAIFDAKRRRAVEGRLKDGHTVDQLKAAVDGCLKWAWHQGENPNCTVYDDFELI